MYRYNNDIPPFIDVLDNHVRSLSDAYAEELVFLDITYLKTFNSDVLAHALSMSDYEHKREVEEIFLDVCLSVILQSNSTITTHTVTESIIDMLKDILTEKQFNVPSLFGNALLNDKLILYIDTLRNNIEHTLSNFGFDKAPRVCHLNFMNDCIYISNMFYAIKDFTSLAVTNNASKHTLCLKVYKRIDRS